MRTISYSHVAVLAGMFAFVAASTAIALAHDHTVSSNGPQWVDAALTTCGAASAACALAVICCQALATRSGSASRAGVALAAVGATSHSVMLAALSLYWSRYYKRAYYDASGRGGPHRRIVLRHINYLQHHSTWSDEDAALFALGCLGGVLAWLVALLASVLAARAARRQAARRMPLAAAAPDAASLAVPVVPQLTGVARPASQSRLGLAPQPAATAAGLLPTSKFAALAAAADYDALLLPATPAISEARAQHA